METATVYWDYIGIMENKMETTSWLCRVEAGWVIEVSN